ncbi:hypothetical protein [Methylobacterium hispanicum]|uniref:hypothetical protein n=1 Tax=Methylobacterium hispanicum TaxID=270350 RepID=UPI001EDF0EB8|nr:hypothetical protein [Methylobacterium hispanicum]
MQRLVRIVCAPVRSGLDAAIQIPGHPVGRLEVHLADHPAGQVGYAPSSPSRRIPPLFLHSIRPALEGAFGTEDAVHAPGAIAALVARLHAGPLGPAPAESGPLGPAPAESGPLGPAPAEPGPLGPAPAESGPALAEA